MAALVLVLVVSACGVAQVNRPAISRSSNPAATTSTGTEQIANSQCPNGLGAGIDTSEWTSHAAKYGNNFPSLAASMLPNGDTLAIASGEPTADTATAAEFRNPCELDPAFGSAGSTELSLAHVGLTISVVYPLGDGASLIAGSTNESNSRWLVGRLTAAGKLDPTFGQNGWDVLPLRGSIGAVAQLSDGNIVLGGNGNGNGNSFVREITSTGIQIPTFGVLGRALMPDWHDGGLQQISIEPNGDILALVGGGGMGCFGVAAVTLTPSGIPVPGFAARFENNLRRVDPGSDCFDPVFVGGIVTGPSGFHLVGTGERDCADNYCNYKRTPDPSQHITDVAFNYAGDLDSSFGQGGVVNFAGSMADPNWTLPQANGEFLFVASPAVDFGIREHHKLADLRFYRVTANGTLDTAFGNEGSVTVPQSYYESFDVVEPSSVPVSNGHQTAIVAIRAPGDVVTLIDVPAS